MGSYLHLVLCKLGFHAWSEWETVVDSTGVLVKSHCMVPNCDRDKYIEFPLPERDRDKTWSKRK